MGMGSEELKTIMKRLGYNQKQFAHRIGVSETAVSLWLQGKRTMHPIFAIHIRGLAKQPVKGAA
jgi:transcriptional regulator with XRE-family HTH domain